MSIESLLKGRRVVEAYRQSGSNDTPVLVAALRRLGFDGIKGFWKENILQELQEAARCYVNRQGECNRCGKCCPNCVHGDRRGRLHSCNLFPDMPDRCIEYPTALDFARGNIPEGCTYTMEKVADPSFDLHWG